MNAVDLEQDTRLDLVRDWLDAQGLGGCELEPASSDASFRRYFRVTHSGGSLIVMDAPPEREDVRPWLRMARRLREIGVNAPEVQVADEERGLVLMSDLGGRSYLAELNEDTVERLYGDALAALNVIQVCGPGAGELPDYDRALLMEEMALFRDWLVERRLGFELEPGERARLDEAFEALADAALEQPRVCVHRDYHSRNLMVTERHSPGVLDFQDAVFGPVTYDLVSLLRDCYIAWPRERVEDWALGFHELAVQSGTLREGEVDEQQFLRWFDWMGVQRHLKAAGIFARLDLRDGKPGYLKDIPRTLGYVIEVAGRYPELEWLGGFAERVRAGI